MVAAINTFGAAGLLSRRANAQSTFYAFDPQGSVSQRSDAGGAVLSSHLFDAHGREATAPSAEPFGYKARWGYYSDAETGLLLLTHRHYDPQKGRFLTRDPIGHLGGVNVYGYVKNNPVNAADPTGLIGLYAYPDGRPRSPLSALTPLSVEFPPHPEDGINSARDAGVAAEMKYFPKNIPENWDAYGGAYRHCVASCILARRYSIWLAYPMVRLWDHNYEQVDDGTTAGDKMGERDGLMCAGGGDQSCAVRCLGAYPTHYC
jgi:RHS repeat-associated protein